MYRLVIARHLSGTARAVIAASVMVVLVVGTCIYLLATPLASNVPKRGAVFETMLDPPTVEETRLIPVDQATAREMNAARPFDDVSITPARAFRFTGDDDALGRAAACLAAAGWYEAGSDELGQRSVMQVVLNRARHPAFARTVCGVVFQGSERTTGCQFTFSCDGALKRTPSDVAWKRALALAQVMLAGQVYAAVGNATHYHTDWVVPYWADSLTKLTKVRTHIFYTWRGYWGTPRAFGSGSGGGEPTVAALARLSPFHLGAPDITPVAPEDVPPIALTLAPTTAPLVLDGVREKSLRGSLVRGQQSPSDHRYFMQLDPAAFAGSYATAALAICKDKVPCKVFGWRDPKQMAVALPVNSAQRAALSFIYAKDGKSSESIFWNCQQMNRSNTAQCLPLESGALQKLFD